MIAVEFYGVPRSRTGVRSCEIEARSIGEALESLQRLFTGLEVLVRGDLETLNPAYRLSLNGDRFVSDPAVELKPGDTLLLLSADVGG
jgi:molybdopterin converting factor small subunit